MSWGSVFHPEATEDSFWPSFTDIMMVIVMTFLLVTVAVVLTNTRLLDELKSSVVAEQEANQRAEFTLQANATLEEQLDYFQQRTSALEMELLRSRAQTENARSELLGTRTELDRLRTLRQQQAGQLAGLEQTLLSRNTTVTRLETELQQTRQQLADLREQTADDRLKLASLEGEYAELDKKYQKLLKPTRSSKGKTVVDVMYSRSGYRIRRPGEESYRTVGLATMNRELSELKTEHGSDLYVKIIIPENSGLSYNQAWVFTRDMLNKYDYYYQEDETETGTETQAE